MIEEIEWDSNFFGRKIGRLVSFASESELLEMLSRAAADNFRYLTCRIDAGEIAGIQLLEKSGFYIVDVGATWERGLNDVPVPEFGARTGRQEDSVLIQNLAEGLFRDGRFYHDPFFTVEEADRLYQAWADNLLKGLADQVFFVQDNGFAACNIAGNTGTITLIGVAGPQRSKGIGRALLQHALRWFRSKGLRGATVRTQSGNSGAVRFYQAAGFTLKSVDVTLGKIL